MIQFCLTSVKYEPASNVTNHLNYIDYIYPQGCNKLFKNVDLKTINFLNAMNSLLIKYPPFKKINKHKPKTKTKFWINFCFEKPKPKFIDQKDPQIKNVFHEKYKTYTETSFLH